MINLLCINLSRKPNVRQAKAVSNLCDSNISYNAMPVACRPECPIEVEACQCPYVRLFSGSSRCRGAAIGDVPSTSALVSSRAIIEF